jgi:hypothetical protein
MQTSVDFWTEILFLSLARNDVSSMIQNELHETKNKSIKPHGGQTYLALKIMILIYRWM